MAIRPYPLPALLLLIPHQIEFLLIWWGIIRRVKPPPNRIFVDLVGDFKNRERAR